MTDASKAARLLQQGLFHHRQGQIEQAMERYVEVLQGDPENADALYYVAVVACQGGELAEGIKL
ncbi:MAG TPA: tetratricopeptide repeat protein, partial [Pseudolabrys sp.]